MYREPKHTYNTQIMFTIIPVIFLFLTTFNNPVTTRTAFWVSRYT